MTTFDRRRALQALAATSGGRYHCWSSASAQTVIKGRRRDGRSSWLMIHARRRRVASRGTASRARSAPRATTSEAPTAAGHESGRRSRRHSGSQDCVDAVVEGVLRRQQARGPRRPLGRGHRCCRSAAPRAADARSSSSRVQQRVHRGYDRRESAGQRSGGCRAAGFHRARRRAAADPHRPGRTDRRGSSVARADGRRSVAAQDALIARLLPQPFSLLSGTVDTKPTLSNCGRRRPVLCSTCRDHLIPPTISGWRRASAATASRTANEQPRDALPPRRTYTEGVAEAGRSIARRRPVTLPNRKRNRVQPA